MEERRDDQPAPESRPTAPCTCGSLDHQPLRIGDRLNPSGGAIGGVYVCPATSASGLEGTL